jgi:hypothetical protein
VVRLLPLFASTLSNGKHRTKIEVQNKKGFAFRAYIPTLKGEVLRANRIKRLKNAKLRAQYNGLDIAPITDC